MILKFATFFKKKLGLNYMHGFCLLWILIIYYTERVYPVKTLQKCQWDRWEPWHNQAISPASIGDSKASGPVGAPTRLGLFGDPQIIDNFSYPGRNYFLKRATIFVTDLYHRKNWVFANRVLNFDRKFFMGDLFDGGREWKSPEQDAQWEEEYSRFMRIFSDPPSVQNSDSRTVFSLPGNHDIGFGNTLVSGAYTRFVRHFGEASSYHFVGNHTIILLDTIAMMNTANDNVYRRPYEFLNNYILSVNDEMKQQPTVLLTHVPLFRDPSLSCGSKRESKKTLPYNKGEQYQTMISPEVSNTILTTIQPIAIFSGDDHDACYIQHNYTVADPAIVQTAEEYTTKSTSMAMGIGRPGIQLVSLYHPRGAPSPETGGPRTFETKICYLPNPFYPFIIFFISGLATLCFLLVFHVSTFMGSPYKQLPTQPLTADPNNKRGFSSAAVEPEEFRHRADKRSGSPAEIELVSSLRGVHYNDEENAIDCDLGTTTSSVVPKTTLATALSLVTSAVVWKRIARDAFIIFFTAINLFVVLSITIYWN